MTLGDNDGQTPFWRAAFWGYVAVVKCLIMSGRDLGDVDHKSRFEGREASVLGIAREKDRDKVVGILELYQATPVQTRLTLWQFDGTSWYREIFILPSSVKVLD